MNYNKKSVEDIDVKGKRVLCRCDFNVPTKEGKITSDKRIVAAMPTIEYLVNHGARVILCSHMGKPKGEWKPELSLQVVADRLSELLGKPVVMAKDVVGEDAKAKAAALKDRRSKGSLRYYSNYQPDYLYVTLKKEWCEELVELDFCDTRLMASKYWHDVLTWVYGDYMTLPPKEKRVPAHSTIQIQVFDEEV